MIVRLCDRCECKLDNDATKGYEITCKISGNKQGEGMKYELCGACFSRVKDVLLEKPGRISVKG